MNAEADYLKRSELRISELQQQVAERERANQHKAKELMKREARVEELEALLGKREQIMASQQESRRLAKRNRASLIAPLLLITCVAAGYLAYEQIDQQRQYFQQVKAAEAHVDKLTRVLNLTQARMVDTKTTMQQGVIELEQTQQKLVSLEAELANLKGAAPDNSQPVGVSLLDILLIQGASREIDQSPPLVLR